MRKVFKTLTLLVVLFSLSLSGVMAADVPAENIKWNQKMPIRTLNYNDVDVYTMPPNDLNVTGSMSLQFFYAGVTGTLDFAEITVSEGSQVIYKVTLDGRTNNESSVGSIGIKPKTEYKISVKSLTQTSFQYQLQVNFIPGIYESESNNTPETATALTNGQPILGGIIQTGDVDYFSFTVPRPGYVTVSLENKNNFNSTPQSANTLAITDAFGHTLYESTFVESIEGLQTIPVGLRGGNSVYYIIIRSNASAANPLQYQLTYNYTQNSNWEQEYNNSLILDYPTAITLNEAFYGSISPLTNTNQVDSDYYHFTLNQNTKVYINFNYGMTGVADQAGIIELYNSNVSSAKPILSETFSGNKGGVQMETGVLAAGNYWIGINASANNLQYDIAANTTKTPNPSEETVTISANVLPNGGGTVTGTGDYKIGDKVTLRANPSSTYSFDGWYDGTNKVSSTNPYTFTVSAAMTLTAQFTKTEPASTVPIYRLYNPGNYEHLYTSDENEVRVLSAGAWVNEGINWYAPTTGVPVYRLNNKALQNHLYTTDQNEINILTTQEGWTIDNNGRPLFYSGGSVPIYRLYNPALRGLHLLTTDTNEYQVLPGRGWIQEGVAFYGVSK